jgi:zinc protease
MTNKYKNIILFAFILLIFCSCGSDKTAGKKNLSLNYSKIVLDNGLTLIVYPDNSIPGVSLQAWIKSGAVYEEKLLGSGASHIVEHMLFEASSSYAQGDIAKEIRMAGGDINAYTSFDRTVFYIDMASSKYKKGLDVLINSLFNTEIVKENFEKEKKIILYEIKSNKDSVWYRIARKMFENMFPNHPYGVPVIGYEDLFFKLNHEDVVEYYKEKYVPNNITLVVAGDINEAKVKDYVKTLVEKQKRGKISVEKKIKLAPEFNKYVEEIEDTDAGVTSILMGYRGPDCYDNDSVVFDVISFMLAGGRNSLLYKELKIDNNLAYAVATDGNYLVDSGFFNITVSCDYDKKQEILKIIDENINYLKHGNFSNKQLKSAIQQIKSFFLFSQESIRGKADILGLSEFRYYDPNYIQSYIDKLENISKKDIKLCVAKYLKDNKMNLFISKPVIPSVIPVQAGIQNQELVIESEAKQSKEYEQNLKVEKIKLKNNAVLLIHKKNDISVVNIRAVLKGGLLTENKDNNGIGVLLSRLLIKGTRAKNILKIGTFVEDRGGSVGAYSANNSLGIEIEMLAEYVDDGIILMKELLFESALNDKQIEKEKEYIIAGIKEEEKSVFSRGFKQLKSVFFKEHPYAMPQSGTIDTINNITKKDLEDYYKKLIVSDNLVVSVFGDVNIEKVKKVFTREFIGAPVSDKEPIIPAEVGIQNKEQVIASIAKQSKNEITLSPEVPRNDAEKSQELVIPAQAGIQNQELVIESKLKQSNIEYREYMDKKQSAVFIGFPSCSVADEDRYVLSVINEIFDGIGGILFDEIRKKQEKAYGVGVYNIIGLDPGIFVFFSLTDKESVELVKNAMLDVINSFKQGNFSEEHIEMAKNSIIASFYRELELNSSFSFSCALDELYGFRYDRYLKYKQKITIIKKDDIIKVMNKYFDETKMKVSIIIGEKGEIEND